MAQRHVEMLIGRLLTDDEFRGEFLDDPHGTLSALRDRGLDLTRTEAAALVATDRAVWGRAAEGLDRRLQKASLSTPFMTQKASDPHA